MGFTTGDHRAALALATGLGLVLQTGCGRHIRAVEVDHQIVSNGRRTATVNTPQFEVSATWVPVPWADEAGPIAFRLEIANVSDRHARFFVSHVKLQDGFGRIYGIITPDKLWRAFSQSTPAQRQAVLVAHRRFVCRPCRPRYACRAYRYPFGYHWYGYPVGYGFYGWYGGWPAVWGPGYYDPYAAEQRTGRFLAQLLESQAIPPEGVASGHVVFAYVPTDDDRLTLRVGLGSPGSPTITALADPRVMVSLIFEVR
jgi:hypothetical protein